MQGLFFICCPYFWNPHSFFVCVQTKQIQGVIKRPRRERRGRERTEKRGREDGERAVCSRARSKNTVAVFPLSLFVLPHCFVGEGVLLSLLKWSLLFSFSFFPQLSSLGSLFPAECSAAAETSRETRRKRPKSSIHSDANADAFRFLSAGQRGRVFCSFHLALDDRRRHAASAE